MSHSVGELSHGGAFNNEMYAYVCDVLAVGATVVFLFYFSPARDKAVVLLSPLPILSADLPPWNTPLLLPFLHALLPRMRHHE
jgi:hypothetical protein